jgi:hypothetical protein
MVFLRELPVPPAMASDHRRIGGHWVRRWVADTADGVLRVVCGLEPIRDDGHCALHLSVSHARHGEAYQAPDRRPTEEELLSALALFPGKRWEREDSTAMIHYFEREP